MDQYTAGLIVIGDEILHGHIVDTNTSYLARNLTTAGVRLQRIVVVPDVTDEIAKEINNASKQYSVVFTSGGTGPTHDDVTYEAVAKAFELKLELHKELMEMYTELIPDQKGIERFAIVPHPCDIITVTSTSTESSVIYPVIKVKNVFILPGHPKYFEPAVDTIIPQLKACTPICFEYIDVESNELSIVNILDQKAKSWKDKVKISSCVQLEPRPFTRLILEGSRRAVIEAKEEFLYYFPFQKIMNIEPRLSYFHERAILEDSMFTEKHVKSAVYILTECYNVYNPDEIFISFNGGKDCTVVLHLAIIIARSREIPSLPCLYVTVDPFPEVEAFVKSASEYYGLEVIRKQLPMRSALSALLEEKCNLKASIMGTRRGDPGSENLRAFTPTDPDWPQLMRINPILNWSYKQVWEFLLKHNVPYCSLYDQGYTSIGSRSTTTQNPLLKHPDNSSVYLPAYTLTDKSTEREGRT